ncbi:MAG: tRNA pseudouridine(55) synthase TruB [Lentimicrobiaceae bacterium]|nr:tRNA pseudouridine(55) synthase TruB [Lentimicrobiaceae bacterium]MCB9024614.1 tRNA pseudouridine(55) synthase TruB [Lentimicrobiaceae bacterium]MCO5265025.1 tRNA pseudouridine(55) synthase TruB [Lentimicrobium sp.]
MHYKFEEGEVLLVNKPLTWTSFDVINRFRFFLKKQLGIKKIKVGHAGTLDPLADGLLIICTGKSTKRIDEFQGQEKEYTGTFRLGATTPSFDLEKEIDQEYETRHITDKMILDAAAALTGEIQQIPPVYSAIKIGGKRAYNYARNEKEVKLEARSVHIRKFEITRIAMPDVDFRISCSKGTYIRSIARDFGELLQSGAHLIALRRTRIGEFLLTDAHNLDELMADLTALAEQENSGNETLETKV